MADNTWKTSLTNIEPNKITVRGYPIDKLMGNVSFSQAIYLMLKGELPSENVGKMMDAMFVSSIDHGVTPPSTLSALTVASTGAAFNAALATGILSINKLFICDIIKKRNFLNSQIIMHFRASTR